MHFNYSFEMAAVLYMGVLLIHFVTNHKFSTAKTKAFFVFLCAAVLEGTLNVASSVCLDYYRQVPAGINVLLVYVFFLLEACTSAFYLQYVVIACELSGRVRKTIAWAGRLPFFFFLLMLALNPFLHFFFDFRDGSYYLGYGGLYGYLYICFFTLLAICSAMVSQKKSTKRLRVTVLIYGIISITAIMVQIFHREFLMTGFSNAIILSIMYLEVQNPNELLDRNSGVANTNGFQLLFQNNMIQEKSMVLFTIDLRQYSEINTVFGYEHGNMIRAQVGEYLGKLCGTFHVFHLSGNSFTVMLTEKEDVDATLDQIWRRFEKPWKIENFEVILKANITEIDFPQHVKNLSEYMGLNAFMKLQLRDKLLDNFMRADKQLIAKYERERKLEIALSRALDEHTLMIYYQPVYSVEKKRIVSLEALVRLDDPELGFIPPDELINLAEHTGNIIPLDLQVLEECCKFLAKHVLSNDSMGIETIQINISVVQCMQQNMADVILNIINQYHIPPERITLEITERAAVSAPGMMKRHMRKLAYAGITFALDDYGTGNSNCSYLINYPFDKVKFDKDMIWSYFESETAKIILENEVRTIHELKIPIVAEGVETKQQLQAMEAMGVEFIQGYYFAKPMPEAECLKLIRQMNQEESWNRI